jgi:hypothetical protein
MTAKRQQQSAKKKPATRKSAESATKKPAGQPLGVWLSLNQAAEEFSCDRGALTRQVGAAGLAPDADGRFRLRDLVRVRLSAADGKADPDKMTPFERQAHFRAEAERMRLDAERGLLIRADDVETEWARVLKIISQDLDVVVDEIERDVGASPAVLEKVEAKIDACRQRMYNRIVGEKEP